MNNKIAANQSGITPGFDGALIGKQQLLIKAKLKKESALVAKQQLHVKAALASQRKTGGSGK